MKGLAVLSVFSQAFLPFQLQLFLIGASDSRYMMERVWLQPFLCMSPYHRSVSYLLSSLVLLTRRLWSDNLATTCKRG